MGKNPEIFTDLAGHTADPDRSYGYRLPGVIYTGSFRRGCGPVQRTVNLPVDDRSLYIFATDYLLIQTVEFFKQYPLAGHA